MKRVDSEMQKNERNNLCDFPSKHLRTARVPIVEDDDWHQICGQNVDEGRLKGCTDTDYFSFQCPKCSTPTLGGCGLCLVGVSDNFDTKPDDAPTPMPIMVFSIHCVRCGFSDFFKIQTDQHGCLAKARADG
jgi:predicted nucleic-acid-binding Zn-ribbon protein